MEKKAAVDLLQKGDMLKQQGKWKEAEDNYRHAVNLDQNSYKGYYNLGVTLSKQKQYLEALNCYRKAIDLNPKFGDTYHKLADVLLVQGEHLEEAVAYYKKAIELNASSYWSYNNLGKTLAKKGEFDRAIECYRSCLNINPDLYEAQKNLESALVKHELDQAAILQRKEIQNNPKSDTGYYRLGEILTRDKKFEEAIFYYRKAIELNPNKPLYYQRLGNALAKQGQSAEAIICVKKLHKLRGWDASWSKDYQFTSDWFTNNLQVWELYLKPFVGKPYVYALEIGSFEGMSTCWLLDNVLTDKTAKITCIDTFSITSWGNKYEDLFDSNIAKTGAVQKVSKIIGMSSDHLRKLNYNSYDFVYIDGSHLAADVLEDAVLSFKLVKNGGLMIFDDYNLISSENPTQNPKIGIDAFLSAFSPKVKILNKSNQLMLKKLSD